MPKLSEDPTKQSGNRRKAVAAFKRRLTGAEREIKALFSNLPFKAREVDEVQINKTLFEYLVDEFGLANAKREIERIIHNWLQTSGSERDNFFSTYIEQSYRQGTITASMRIQLLAEQAGFEQQMLQQLDGIALTNNPNYRSRVSIQLTRAFTEMKGFSEDVIVNIARILNETVGSGSSPRLAQRAIRKQFNTSRKRAEAISRTEINRTNSIARMETAKRSRELGIDVRVIHRSALLPDRTRTRHGLRHGEVFTIEEQAQWWDEGTNRINCLCSVSEVVVDENGKPYDTGLIKRFEKQRKEIYGK